MKEEPGEILAPLWIQVQFVLTNLSDGSDVVMQLGVKGCEEFLAVGCPVRKRCTASPLRAGLESLSHRPAARDSRAGGVGEPEAGSTVSAAVLVEQRQGLDWHFPQRVPLGLVGFQWQFAISHRLHA